MSNLRSLYAEKKDVFAGIQDLEGRAAKEQRSFTAEEREQWDKMYARMDELIGDIERFKKSEELVKREAAELRKVEEAKKEVKPENREARQKLALRNYVIAGKQNLSKEDRDLLKDFEKRGTDTLVTTTDSLGGYLVPEFWWNEIISQMEYYAGVLEAANLFGGVINSTNGGDLHIPFTDDTATKAVLTSEANSTTVQDFTFSETILNAYTYRTLVKISYEQMNDSGYDLMAFITREFAKRFGRALNTAGTTGTGSSQPNGFMTASSAGATTSSVDAFTRQDILTLIANVDRAYRVNAAFQLSDEALFDIRALEIGSSDSRPLWQPSIRDGEPDRIEGFPYIVNNDIAAPSDGAESKIMAFGDWEFFKVRFVNGQNIQRLNERFADNMEVGLLGWQRIDTDLVDSAAIKHMVTAAS